MQENLNSVGQIANFIGDPCFCQSMFLLTFALTVGCFAVDFVSAQPGAAITMSLCFRCPRINTSPPQVERRPCQNKDSKHNGGCRVGVFSCLKVYKH